MATETNGKYIIIKTPDAGPGPKLPHTAAHLIDIFSMKTAIHHFDASDAGRLFDAGTALKQRRSPFLDNDN